MADAFRVPLGLSLRKEPAVGGLCPGQQGANSVACVSPSHFMVATLQTRRFQTLGCSEKTDGGGKKGKGANF